MSINAKKLLLPGIVCLAFLLGTALSHYGRAAETQQITDGTPSQVLVQEIRALRRTMQDFTIGNSRLQVTIERCRLQQATVERLNDEYNSVQSQIESNEDQVQQIEETTKNIERLLSAETDSLRRGEMEREQKNITNNIEQIKQRTQKLQERRTLVSGMLQSERAKLNEFKESLDSLEHSLANQQADRK